MTARRLLGALLAGLLVACGGEPPEGEPRVAASAVVGGERSGADQDGVLLLRALLDEGEVLCTASLVAPNLVITARHCVSYLSPGPFQCSASGELIETPEGGGGLGLHVPPSTVEVYGGDPPRDGALARGTQILSTLSPTICKNDMAFVVLDKRVDAPIVPLRLGRPAERGETTLLVGYGVTKEGQRIDYLRQKRAQKRGLTIAGVGPDSVSSGVSNVAPRSILIQGPSGCVGDSGGPLLAQDTGALLGVYSLLEGASCESVDVLHHFVHVPAFGDLIDRAFTAAGESPQLESSPPDPPNNAESGGGSGGAGGASPSEEAPAESEATPGGASGASSESPVPPKSAKSRSGCAFGGGSRSGPEPLLAPLALLAIRLFRRRRFARS